MHLARILPVLLTSLEESHSTPEETVELGYAQVLVLCVQDETGLSYVMDILLNNCMPKDSVTKRGAVTLLLFRSLTLLFTDSDHGVLVEAWSTLTVVTKTLDAGAQMSHVPDVRLAVRFAVADEGDSVGLASAC